MKVRMTLGAAVAMGILVLGAIPVAASEAAQQVEVTGLEGSWRIYITPDEGEAPPVPLLATFGLGASYVQHAGPGQSTAHGSWRRLGDRFGLTFEQYIFDPGSGRPCRQRRSKWWRASIWTSPAAASARTTASR